MSTSDPHAPKSRFFSPRRLMLLAGVAGLGAAVLFTAPGFVPNSSLPALNSSAYAQSVQTQRPVGFADIVEKVKPAVISVRVKIDNGPRMSFDSSPSQRGAPMDRFFRRLPDSAVPDEIGRAHV